jgi:hypothetical protein
MRFTTFQYASAGFRQVAGSGIKDRMPILIWVLLLGVPALSETISTRGAGASKPSIREGAVHGRHAYFLENGLIRVGVLTGGGHIAEVTLVSEDPKKRINPMRVPHYPTIDPHTYESSKHDAVYGDSPHKWLHSGYMGHLLCFPIYGSPSEQEAKAGLGNHGEAGIVEWKKTGAEVRDDAVVLRYGADLTKTGFRVERVITLRRGDRFARVEEAVENMTPYDRPIQWMQHATFGPPFVEPGKTILDMSATRGAAGGGAEVRWPDQPTDQRAFRTEPKSGAYTAYLMDPGRQWQYFTMFHRDYRLLIGYVFPAKDNPWIADWQENKRSQVIPWNGQAVARGMEFGNSPFAEGLRKAVERKSLFGVPAFTWIGGRERQSTEFLVFALEIPDGFQGVADVKMESGVPVVVSE